VAGRSSATANALAAPAPPDLEALALLWAVGPWREELRQLLLLLADRADHPACTPCPRRCRCPCASMAALVAKRAVPTCSPPLDSWMGAAPPAATSASRSAASATGQRYIHHAARGSRVLLFVREERRVDGRPGGVTEPFRCLGFAAYESHEGERIWLVQEWRSAGGWGGRSRWGGCR